MFEALLRRNIHVLKTLNCLCKPNWHIYQNIMILMEKISTRYYEFRKHKGATTDIYKTHNQR